MSPVPSQDAFGFRLQQDSAGLLQGRRLGVVHWLELDRATARDLFDLAVVIERDPQSLRNAATFINPHRAAFIEQIADPGRGLLAAFAAIQTLVYQPTYAHCAELARSFLQ